MFAKFGKQARLRSDALHVSDAKMPLKNIFGFRMSFLLEASGTAGMKNGTHKEVITRTLGMAPGSVILP